MKSNGKSGKDRLESLGKNVQKTFATNKRVLSYEEYIRLVESDPQCHCRNAAEYTRDMFDYFGSETVLHPRGEIRRFKLFDVPWDEGRGRLVGQEECQNAIYRILNNFVRQRMTDRFILLHGPNGSSKSTIADTIASGLERYSNLPEGAIYRFNWIFPTQGTVRSGIGFSGEKHKGKQEDSYAHLEDLSIDARIPCELKDHPLLLIPLDMRMAFLDGLEMPKGHKFSDYLAYGDLCQKCKLIYEALLSTYEGDFLKVLKHVQVERFYISQRYRFAAARVEPQMAVDAVSRQITTDRSLAALPTALQSIVLYESDGELVQANRGLIDFSDLLKRPLEVFKYLLTAVEDGRVAMDQTNLFMDLVFVGSANEGHLNAFMESPEWMSFRGRLELIRVPYLLDYRQELKIYEDQIPQSQVNKHIAPYATSVAAFWAVLSRMHRPEADNYEGALKDFVGELTPAQKAILYAEKEAPEGITGDAERTLKGAIGEIYGESDGAVVYEGLTGASPREVKTVILNAAQGSGSGCVTPERVLGELVSLVQESSAYEFLRQEPEGPGYYDHRVFVEKAREWYLAKVDDDLRVAMGLVEDASYGELFGRYANHVIHYVRKEKVRNLVTGKMEEPDRKLMEEVERVLEIAEGADEFRNEMITKVGAWSVDNQGTKPDYRKIFPEYFEQLREGYFGRERSRVERILKSSLDFLSEEDNNLTKEEEKTVKEMLGKLEKDHGYCEECAKEAITMLLRTRYAK
ncbi:MAG: serine protein kinase PrkA [Pseudomonadota bacterium]